MASDTGTQPVETAFPKYGEIWDVELEPTTGSEIGKRRSAVTVSNDSNNQYSSTVTVLPVTGSTTRKAYRFEVIVPKGIAGLTMDSRIKVDQVRTIDKSRLAQLRGVLPQQYLPQIELALKIHLNMK
jgi:mRNA interferase MazF